MENQSNSNEDKKKGGSALRAASMGRSATEQVDPHSNSGLANTGTNISYEGATAPGAGGSVGSGYASGKAADDETISSNSDYTQNRGGSPSKTANTSAGKMKKDEEDTDEEDTDEEYIDDDFDAEEDTDEEEEMR